ncbi:MAG: hypothetical protein M1817_002725 [Caeruleum heppii]|nr:MAG: hypothetical protein M1817_002725 [Caeruleum heppii]
MPLPSRSASVRLSQSANKGEEGSTAVKRSTTVSIKPSRLVAQSSVLKPRTRAVNAEQSPSRLPRFGTSSIARAAGKAPDEGLAINNNDKSTGPESVPTNLRSLTPVSLESVADKASAVRKLEQYTTRTVEESDDVLGVSPDRGTASPRDDPGQVAGDDTDRLRAPSARDNPFSQSRTHSGVNRSKNGQAKGEAGSRIQQTSIQRTASRRKPSADSSLASKPSETTKVRYPGPKTASKIPPRPSKQVNSAPQSGDPSEPVDAPTSRLNAVAEAATTTSEDGHARPHELGVGTEFAVSTARTMARRTVDPQKGNPTRQQIRSISQRDGEHQGPQRPAFSTLQRHFTPKKAPKSSISNTTREPINNIGIGSDTGRDLSMKQIELLQLDFLLRSAAETQSEWRESAKRRLTLRLEKVAASHRDLTRRESEVQKKLNLCALADWKAAVPGKISLDQKAQKLGPMLQDLSDMMAPGGRYHKLQLSFEGWLAEVLRIWHTRDAPRPVPEDLAFVEPLTEERKTQSGAVARKLVSLDRGLDELGPAHEGSALSALLSRCRTAVADLQTGLGLMQELEQNIGECEQQWITAKVGSLDASVDLEVNGQAAWAWYDSSG